MRKLHMLGLLAAPVLLAGCVDDDYYDGPVAVGYYAPQPYYYGGYYDGYYGPIYDGYWGSDGFFYYRHYDRDRYYARADRDHFRRERPGRDDYRWREFRHEVRPDREVRMPYFDPARGGRGEWHRGDRDRRYRDDRGPR